MPPFPPRDFAIQILLPAPLNAQPIPGTKAELDYSTTSLWKFASMLKVINRCRLAIVLELGLFLELCLKTYP
jgi:hypothetical protein